MEWSGKLNSPKKYTETTYKDNKVGFVQLVKNVNFDDDGYVIEKTSVHLYDEHENLIETYIPCHDLPPYALADYILCDIQDEDGLSVNK